MNKTCLGLLNHVESKIYDILMLPWYGFIYQYD